MEMQRMRELCARAERAGVSLLVHYYGGEGAESIGGCARLDDDHLVVDGFITYGRIPVADVLSVEALPAGRR